jgi:hypothetical protein
VLLRLYWRSQVSLLIFDINLLCGIHSPLTSVPAFSKCPLKLFGAVTAPVAVVGSTFCAVLPACRRVFIKSRGFPIIIPAAPDT